MNDQLNTNTAYLSKHISISLLNLLLVSIAGVLLRYKMLFPLPFIDQSHLLHAHSHFAFTGWISHILMTLIITRTNAPRQKHSFYNSILMLNLFAAYGMFISFILQGYAFFSIIFSFLSILVTFVFGLHIFRDSTTFKFSVLSLPWFKAAVVFNMLSSIGTFMLAYQMAKGMNNYMHFASVYFYLHFQYNGWFFFGAMGLFISLLHIDESRAKIIKNIFWLFVSGCAGTYLLSILWLHLSSVYIIIAATCSLLQLIAWLTLFYLLYNGKLIFFAKSRLNHILFLLAGIALTIKLLLQTASIFPELNKLVFGFRPIIIGYLHLVFLVIITIFILAYLLHCQLLTVRKITIRGIIIFISGILLNEFSLLLQGFFALYTIAFPHINYFLLFFAALVMLTGLLVINYDRLRIKRKA